MSVTKTTPLPREAWDVILGSLLPFYSSELPDT